MDAAPMAVAAIIAAAPSAWRIYPHDTGQPWPVAGASSEVTGIDEQRLRSLLAALRDGELGLDEAVSRLRDLPYEDLGYARVDHHRALREGFPEVVFGLGKTPQQITGIVDRIIAHSERVLVTRATPEAFAAVAARVPDAVYHQTARAITVERRRICLRPGVALLCAGTADLPVAEEAAITAQSIGSEVDRVYDVGVAGIHRLFGSLERVRAARVIIVVAGMEGALPSVVAGLVATPVIAVPTSVGYGASFRGLSALLTMLNSCATGVSVVNIDNGFGAGYIAAMINRQSAPADA